jgi:serine protease
MLAADRRARTRPHVSDAINWPAAQVPALGHHCFIALVGSATDPAPSPGDLLNWTNFVNFIQNNNQVAWHNFNVNPPPPSPPPGLLELPFLVVGAPLEGVLMALEVEAHLAQGAKVFLDAPWTLIDSLRRRSPFVTVNKKAPERGLLPLSPHALESLGEAFFAAGAQIECRLRVQLPANGHGHPYELGVRQLYEGIQVGRIGWQLLPPGGGRRPGRGREDEPRGREERRGLVRPRSRKEPARR